MCRPMCHRAGTPCRQITFGKSGHRAWHRSLMRAARLRGQSADADWTKVQWIKVQWTKAQ
jgi:hypothetical protein